MHALYQLLADGKFHSGAELGKKLGITRAAVWKRIKKIKQEQQKKIISIPGKGYQLTEKISLLNKGAIEQNLHDAQDIRIECSLDSSNELAKQLLKQSAAVPVVITEEQTAGRGRRGRFWFSPYAENLYLSYTWPVVQGLRQIEGLSLVAGLAVYQTLQPYITDGLGLKWPNDVLINDKKIAGILTELIGDPSDHCFAVIGIGINANMRSTAPDITQPWTSIAHQTGGSVDRNILAAELINNLHALLLRHQREGFAYIHEQWQQAHLWQGKKVVLSFADEIVEGWVTGVNERGELKLFVRGEERIFTGGELSLRLDHDT